MVFFQIIGVGVFVYGLLYMIATSLVDCDLELFMYSLIGRSPGRLKGKVVFITGASSGIGEHTAIALAKYGVKLVLAARRRGELERVKRICITESKGQLRESDVLVQELDVTDLTSHRRVFQEAVRHFGQIDILFNNAGRSQRAEWESIDIAVDKQMFELNVFGVVHLTRVAMEHFNSKGVGHVAVVSSIAGVVGAPFSSSYTGSKHAIHGYFNSLRNEKAGHALTVTLICPGPTFSNFLQESFTGRNGEKYGIAQQSSDRRMRAERCGQLCAISLANKCRESWMGLFPILPLTYFAVFFPILFNFGVKVVGPNKFMKMRDSKEYNPTEDKRSD